MERRFAAGQYGKFECPYCKTNCDVKRNQTKPPIRGMASAIAWSGVPDPYDHFICPNGPEVWHLQIEKLHEEMASTASHSLRAIIKGDIEEILKHQRNTVEKRWDWGSASDTIKVPL